MAPDEIRRFDGIVRNAFMSIRIVDGKRIFLVLPAVLRNRLLFATSSKVIWALKVEGDGKKRDRKSHTWAPLIVRPRMCYECTVYTHVLCTFLRTSTYIPHVRCVYVYMPSLKCSHMYCNIQRMYKILHFPLLIVVMISAVYSSSKNL